MWPFGVPNVRSSIPEVAMRPVGRDEVAMVREKLWKENEGFVIVVVFGMRWVVVWESLWKGRRGLNMKMKRRRCDGVNWWLLFIRGFEGVLRFWWVTLRSGV